MARYGMVIDLKRCVGCNACSIACKQVNGLPRQAKRTCVLTEETGTYPATGYTLTPMICMQCDNPACVAACPTGASIQGEDGVVYIQKDVCIGCQTCIQVCPSGARTYLEAPEPLFGSSVAGAEAGMAGAEAGMAGAAGTVAWEAAHGYENFPEMTVDKCNFCKARRDRGELPACVATCAAGARIFGDLDDENSEISVFLKENADRVYRYLEDLGTEPKVYFCK